MPQAELLGIPGSNLAPYPSTTWKADPQLTPDNASQSGEELSLLSPEHIAGLWGRLVTSGFKLLNPNGL